ncbi:sporulation protein YpjB [Paenibacillus macquariensis]|uniref:Sporulation protein YpjB n=1 Tax=Paenibacillus macquariensis TaxID=948756 RepID=A0ABY1JJI3_9BACL|nr:sporulation protein YpjB [Paenibacillus macquariensis]MEC0089736.1 sporulation protein YpjB [Paenibacillus macquariensis]OAB30786.1 hypothetical protein PMSM_21865 [Paenibacillus macquariensis subsp. macquariensis]SIQ30018.1 sporulation protein YpjB [Paenibacillus macquariensis]
MSRKFISHPLLTMLVVFIIVFMPDYHMIWADESSSLPSKQAGQLSEAVETLYRDVVDGNITKVRLETEQIEKLFTSSSFQGLTEVEGIHALAECIVEVKIATAQATLQPELWLQAIAKLRLAADSLSNRQQPLWHQYYKVVREDLSTMQSQFNLNNKEGLKQAYDSLQTHYELIRPAIVIQKKPFEVNMIDSWISYAGGVTNTTTSNPEAIRSMISQGEEHFNTLFGKKKDEPAFAPQIQYNMFNKGLWIGALFIVSILSYVGYRKYRGEQTSMKALPPPKI